MDLLGWGKRTDNTRKHLKARVEKRMVLLPDFVKGFQDDGGKRSARVCFHTHYKISANIPASASLKIHIYETGARDLKLVGINTEITGDVKSDIIPVNE